MSWENDATKIFYVKLLKISKTTQPVFYLEGYPTTLKVRFVALCQ